MFYTLLYFVCSKSDDVFSPAQKCSTSFRLKIIFSGNRQTNFSTHRRQIKIMYSSHHHHALLSATVPRFCCRCSSSKSERKLKKLKKYRIREEEGKEVKEGGGRSRRESVFFSLVLGSFFFSPSSDDGMSSNSLLAFAFDDDDSEYKLFTGKASNVFQFEVPKDWVIAIDRPVEEKQKKKAETKVVVGQFKTVDTMSVRLEIADESVRKAFALAEEKKDAKYIEQEFTKEEREAAAGKIAQDVIVGVENNRSGVMKFVNVGDENENTTKRIERDGKAYYVFQSISEVCRAEITEIGGGKKICIGPRGDEIDTIERRAMTVVTVPDANDGSYFVLKMSAKVDRWEETKEKFERAAETFRML